GTVGGGVAGGLIGIVMAFAGFASGPLQLIHLGELLGHNFSKSQSDSEDRTSHLLRYAKAYKNKDFRFTRVGLIGARTMNKAVQAFEDAGIKFDGQDALGRPTQVTIDREKLGSSHPETQGMTDEELKSWLNDQFGTTDFQGSGNDIKLDISGLKASSMSKLISSSRISLVGDGKITTAIKTRSLKKFFGLGSLFHPFSRAIEDKIAAKIAADQKAKQEGQNTQEEPGQAAQTVEQQTFDSEIAPIEAPGVDAFNTVNEDANSPVSEAVDKAGSVFGYMWVTGCVLEGTGKSIVTMNRDLTVVPAMLEATSLIAAASQAKAGGSDAGMNQMSGLVKSFTDPKTKQSIWNSPPMMILNGTEASSLQKNKDGSIVNDLPDARKQAFGDQTSASNMTDAGNFLLDLIGMNELHSLLQGVPVASQVTDPCSLTAALTVAAAGLVINGVSLATDLEDGGASTALQWTLTRGAEEGVKAYVGSELLGLVTNQIIHSKAAPKLAADAFKGPVGGDLIAYGARAAANTAAIASGGISLANSASTIIGTAGQQEQQQFRSENAFAKMFDINDYRSLTGQLSMDIKPTLGANLLSLVGTLQNMGGNLFNAFGSLLPHAVADSATSSWTGNYDYGFPQYGIPDSMLNDPNLADPYQNAESVGQYLSSVCADSSGIGTDKNACANGTGGGYTARIKTCFGNDLTYAPDSDIGGNVWDVTPASHTDVDPNSTSYQKAQCGDVSDMNWRRIVMFVNDANDIKAIDCFMGDSTTSDQSCTDEGMNGATSASAGTTASVPPGTLVWPFAAKNPSQYQRIDQGWDVQDSAGAPVYAVTSGTLHVYNGACGGFGNDYPVEQLDSALSDPPGSPAGSGDWIYYGHVHILPSLNGQHVTAGQEIATTNTADGGSSCASAASQNGSAAPAGWLEIGFSQPGTDVPAILGPEGSATAAGQAMHDLLINAQPAGT
ncbi:MAG TPA: hypothetical protein VFN56_01435, partial [Candidatus Saccharimonadales bacterium]|nr:hypothetical protein [Candidatus Saccharimonadales bacterium]